jgi:S1-C subfamily serine protease
MKKRNWRIGCVALLLGASISTPTAASDLSDLADRTKTAVVLLTIEDSAGTKVSSGTGFLVSTDGRIVTNHHVIDGAASVTATLSSGEKCHVLGILADDQSRDIAILAAEGASFPALSLGDSSGVRPGDEVVVIGSPMGFAGTLTVGIVSAIRERGAGEEDTDSREREKFNSWGIQISAAIAPGSSGSPIMTKSGVVIAVAVGMIHGSQGLNFGIPIEVAKGLLHDLGPTAKLTPFSGAGEHDLLRNLLISAAVFGLVALIYVLWGRVEERRSKAR